MAGQVTWLYFCYRTRSVTVTL